MRAVFADTFYFIALYAPEDDAHNKALEFSNAFRGSLVTTTWVLVELADAFATPENRAGVAGFIWTTKAQPNVIVVQASDEQFEEALRFYESRLDKRWSLTDCLSFTAMKKYEIIEALTGDHHFEQAGFVALLK